MLLRIQHRRVCLIPGPFVPREIRAADKGNRNEGVLIVRLLFQGVSVFTALRNIRGGCDSSYRQSDEGRRLDSASPESPE
jgi:hypothetical protein